MSRRNVVTTGTMFLIVAALIAASQFEAGGQRLLIGAALALPWAAGGVAILRWPHVGAWLGLAVAAISLVVAGWILVQVNSGNGAVAGVLFESSDGGGYTLSEVFFWTFLFSIAATWCAGATIWLLTHGSRRGELPTTPAHHG